MMIGTKVRKGRKGRKGGKGGKSTLVTHERTFLYNCGS